MTVRYYEHRIPLTSATERADVVNGLVRGVASGCAIAIIGIAAIIGFWVYAPPMSAWGNIVFVCVSWPLALYGTARAIFSAVSLGKLEFPERVTIEEREEPAESDATELLDIPDTIRVNAGTAQPAYIERTRRPQTIGGFRLTGRLLDALELQARDDRMTRQPLLDANLITTAEYMQMTDALVGVGYLEQNGRGYRWTDSGYDWITLPHSGGHVA